MTFDEYWTGQGFVADPQTACYEWARTAWNRGMENAANICADRFKTWDGNPPIDKELEYGWMADEAKHCERAIRREIQDDFK